MKWERDEHGNWKYVNDPKERARDVRVIGREMLTGLSQLMERPDQDKSFVKPVTAEKLAQGEMPIVGEPRNFLERHYAHAIVRQAAATALLVDELALAESDDEQKDLLSERYIYAYEPQHTSPEYFVTGVPSELVDQKRAIGEEIHGRFARSNPNDPLARQKDHVVSIAAHLAAAAQVVREHGGPTTTPFKEEIFQAYEQKHGSKVK